MKNFKLFFKTNLGMLPQSETGATKKAEDGGTAMADSMRSAFGGTKSADPAPAPAPADVSSSGGSLASAITGGLNRLTGG